jgi:hypothetical protein
MTTEKWKMENGKWKMESKMPDLFIYFAGELGSHELEC